MCFHENPSVIPHVMSGAPSPRLASSAVDLWQDHQHSQPAERHRALNVSGMFICSRAKEWITHEWICKLVGIFLSLNAKLNIKENTFELYEWFLFWVQALCNHNPAITVLACFVSNVSVWLVILYQNESIYDMPPVPDCLSQSQNQPWFWTDATSKSWWVHVPPITTLVGPIVLTSFKAFCMSLKSPEFKAMTSIPMFQKLRKHEGLRHLSEYLYMRQSICYVFVNII